MHYGMKTVGLSLILGLFALSSGTGRSAEVPPVSDLLGRVVALQEGISVLEQSGHLSHGQAKTLNKKLDRATKALSGLNGAQGSGEVSAQQQQSSFLGELQKAIDALLQSAKGRVSKIKIRQELHGATAFKVWPSQQALCVGVSFSAI